MKNIFRSAVSLLVFLAITSCSPQFNSWTNPDYKTTTFKKIVVYGISDNITSRLSFETTMVDALKAAGIDAVSAYDYKKNNNKPSEGETAAILQALLDDGVDAIITTAVVDKNIETQYNPGSTYSVPSYGRTFRGYSYRTYGYVQEPGYYTQNTVYLLENNFYAISENGVNDNDALVWSGQSEESKPTNPDKMNRKYAQQLLQQLKADGILK